jgi:hypothetical protein
MPAARHRGADDDGDRARHDCPCAPASSVHGHGMTVVAFGVRLSIAVTAVKIVVAGIAVI